MKIIRSQREVDELLRKLRKRSSGIDDTIVSDTKKILGAVRRQGDSAVRRFTKKFDRTTVSTLKLSATEIKRYAGRADKNIVRALEISAARIRRFHEKQCEKSWAFSYAGATLGQMIRPLARVGVYVPGGKATYPSTVLMNVIPAQVAGVPDIALCVPTPDNEINPYVMAAVTMLGVKEVYRIGGAQAIGAFAYGTETIKKVDKIVGPGNIYVATAKKLVFGDVDIDMIAGPSEVLILADRTANPVFVATDLLSQAEHDEHASSICITDSVGKAREINEEVQRQLRSLSRNDIAKRSLKNYGAIIVVNSLKKATELSNRIAPEHLEIMTGNPRSVLKEVTNAGAIFLGKWTPEPVGDYAAGPNHTLPTGGTARFFSPLGVYDFVKRSSLLEFSREGFRQIADIVETIADIEGLEAHANTIRVRKKSK